MTGPADAHAVTPATCAADAAVATTAADAGGLPGARTARGAVAPPGDPERSGRPGWTCRTVAAAGVPRPPALLEMESVITPFVDAAFYRAANPDVAADGVEPLHHYCRCGWREGRDPSPAFSTGHYLATYPDVAEQGINPLWHFVAIGRLEGRTPLPAGTMADRGAEALGPLFDPAFYIAANPDVRGEAADPLAHYLRFGGQEHRAPNRWFDTGFYLAANQDVAASGVNPLLHYSLVGRDRNRPARNPGPDRKATLRGLLASRQRDSAGSWPASVSLLMAGELLRRLSARMPCRLLVLSFSHDAYTREIGGTQILIADEQAQFAARGAAYLHLAPVLPRLHLVHGAPANPLRATLDGTELGCFEAATLAEALGAMASELPEERLLVCHCLLGHDPDDVARLHAALLPRRAVFWVHDFSSLCEGYTLLRNDTAFCAAPPPDSMGCRICVHGASREEHLRAMHALFEAVAFEVVAPSNAALAIWRRGTALPHRSAVVHPHVAPSFTARRRSLVPEEQRGTAAAPVRVAFVGHPAGHKGWPGFCRVVEDCAADPAYRFFHLGVMGAAPALPIHNVTVRVTSATRDAMRTAIEEHAIDLVLVLSPWPETFSFVTHEALAAGADVVALADSGNVADEVLRSGRGVVFDGLEAVRDFFTSGRAVDYVRLCFRQGGNPAGTLRHLGATASLGGPAAAAPSGIFPPTDGRPAGRPATPEPHSEPHAEMPG